jgi:putative transposase
LNNLWPIFKGAHFPRHILLYAAFFYVRQSVSYRDLQESMEERGVNIDHVILALAAKKKVNGQ